MYPQCRICRFFVAVGRVIYKTSVDASLPQGLKSVWGNQVCDSAEHNQKSLKAGKACYALPEQIWASMDWAETTARRDEKHVSFRTWCDLYNRFDRRLNRSTLKDMSYLTGKFNNQMWKYAVKNSPVVTGEDCNQWYAIDIAGHTFLVAAILWERITTILGSQTDEMEALRARRLWHDAWDTMYINALAIFATWYMAAWYLTMVLYISRN